MHQVTAQVQDVELDEARGCQVEPEARDVAAGCREGVGEVLIEQRDRRYRRIGGRGGLPGPLRGEDRGDGQEERNYARGQTGSI